ncbi:Fic family protein [Corynebacterium kalidii]|uniref:Fic family protein n=1 Tax=Corynebacterium kalidii TaxID=2931982 RepID=A0A9X2B005_9CORY|nr:Fic family protein [Corynebacterium kalidii]MCJ7859092.1 Fic family protein [Corynebacterium kalidii]
MAYRTLKSIFHQKDQASADREETARRGSPAALQWDFPIGENTMFCLITPEIATQIEQIMLRENRARELWRQLPGGVHHHYLRSMIIEEIHATNEIESIHSTRQEIAEVLDAANGLGASQRRRFREMARLYLALADGKPDIPEDLDDLRTVYDEVTAGEITSEEAPDGERFRTGPVRIFDGQKVIHQGTPTEELIDKGLQEMLRQSRDETIPFLIRVVAAHFIFENVHPFYDGNGRTGRYLLALDLTRCLSPVAWLSLSASIADNKDRYYRAFQNAEHPLNKGDVTVFVAELLSIIAEALGRLSSDLELRKTQLERIFDHINDLEGSETSPLADTPPGTLSTLSVIGQASLFGERGEVDLDTIARTADKSKQYARKRTIALVDSGFVAETSGKPLRFRLTGPGRSLLGLATA